MNLHLLTISGNTFVIGNVGNVASVFLRYYFHAEFYCTRVITIRENSTYWNDIIRYDESWAELPHSWH